MSAHNKALSRRWFEEVWNQKSVAAIDELLCPECIGHMESGEIPGVEPFKRVRDEFLAAFPDLRMEVEDVISDGDDVVVRWRATGTHSGDGLGLEPTNRPIAVRGITWHRYRDGKMVEGWDSWNQEALIQKLREGSDEQKGRDLQRRQDLAARVGELREDLFGPRGGPEMARRLNIPVRTYYNYESGVTIPAEVLLEIIEITGANPAWLLRGEGPRYADGRRPKLEV